MNDIVVDRVPFTCETVELEIARTEGAGKLVQLSVVIRDEYKQDWPRYWERVAEAPSTVTFCGRSYVGSWIQTQCSSTDQAHVIRAAFQGKQVEVAP